MKVHLIHSSEFSHYQFKAIHELICQYPGPVEYIIHCEPAEYEVDELEEDLWDEDRVGKTEMPLFSLFNLREEPVMVTKLSWTSIFDRCNDARVKYAIPEDEPVVLLTDHANQFNWFSGSDRGGKLNMFVHTGMWDRFIPGDFRYPVVYELASIPLQLMMFDSFQELVTNAHRTPLGCMNDLCQDKKQIRLKLRTGDICPECQSRILSKNIDPLIVSQVFRIFEGIRNQLLFRSSLVNDPKPSRLLLDYRCRKIYLSDLGNLEVPLGTMEKTVFHFFLNHPNGIAFSSLPDHKDELIRLYRHYSDTPSEATIIARVEEHCQNLNDRMSTVISRIRKKIEAAAPIEIAGQYVIGGEPGSKRKILIDRSLVSILQ
jgi:hypothetical protein